MNYNEALDYINDKDKYGSRLGLESITRLLDKLGNPQDKLEYIHVAGTNGKGSVCAFIASVLKEANYKTGLFTSPYLERFTERIQINNQDIPPQELAKYTLEVKEAIDELIAEGYEHPTTFEIVTAVAFIYFERNNVDIVVLEVGLGGRYDSTNVIKAPLAAVITTIDYDHVDILGKTLAEIAYQKGGIIKAGSLVVTYPQPLEAENVLEQICEDLGSELIKVDLTSLKLKEETYLGSEFSYSFSKSKFDSINIKLIGDYQLNNSATAITTLVALREKGLVNFTDDELYKGLKNARWNGRLELLQSNPYMLIDGAHNLQGMAQLEKAVELFPYKKLILGIGILKDKDYKSMMKIIAHKASTIICTQVDMPRALPAEELGKVAEKFCSDVIVEKSRKGALELAFSIAEEEDMILFCGSIYLIGEIRTLVNNR